MQRTLQRALHLKVDACDMNLGRNARTITVAALLLFGILALILTYPLSLHLADAAEDWQDALLNVWITAWDGHQLLIDPTHLFDANIFYPYPQTLAYSELLLGNALLALPITVISGNPVLGYNVALLLSFVLSGFGTYLLVLRLTRSPGAAVVAGIIFAFCSFRMTNLAQVQLITTQWMPLALLSLLQLVRRRRPRYVVTFALFFSLQAVSCFYYAFLLAFAVAGYAIWMWAAHRTIRNRRTVLYLLVTASFIAVLVLPFAVPYFQVSRELGLERTLEESEPFSASLCQYLLVPPGSVVNGRWLPSDDTPQPGGYPVDALFPGLVASALGLWGLLRGRDRDRWFFLLLLLAAVCLSFGPRLYTAPGQPSGLDLTLPYAWFYRLVPGAKALRAPVRFDVLAMLALAVLAGYGAATFRRRYAHALLTALVASEALVWPAAHVEPVPLAAQIPPVYHWLADQPPEPMLELPMVFVGEGRPLLEYQYMSVYHWHPTPDGFSGFFPPTQDQLRAEIGHLPSERSVSLLQALDVRYLIIHTDYYAEAEWRIMKQALVGSEALTLVETLGPDEVYQVRQRSFDPVGLAVQSFMPSRAITGQPYTAYVVAVNHDQRSHAVSPTDTQRATVTWETAKAHTTTTVEMRLPLLTSPHGGATVAPLSLVAPTKPGSYRLRIQAQEGPWGEWSSERMVEVGDQADSSFPVPARLAAWSIPADVHPGQPLDVNLTWHALGEIDAYYSTYIKLIDSGWQQIAGWDGPPRNGEAPTNEWLPGEVIDDAVTLMVPADVAPGDYTVEVGMYRAKDLAHALTLTGDDVLVDRVVLGTVRIVP